MRRCVWSRNLKNGEAMVRVGPQRHRKQTKQTALVGTRVRFMLSLFNAWTRKTARVLVSRLGSNHATDATGIRTETTTKSGAWPEDVLKMCIDMLPTRIRNIPNSNLDQITRHLDRHKSSTKTSKVHDAGCWNCSVLGFDNLSWRRIPPFFFGINCCFRFQGEWKWNLKMEDVCLFEPFVDHQDYTVSKSGRP